jgi:SAM-dependent methyltransferase
MSVSPAHLHALYAETTDPWGFADSDYEQAKFVATRRALLHGSYGAAFELGCGNGQLARHLAGLCGRYVGMDAVEKAVAAAREAVPDATFVQGFYPCPLPQGPFELLILSEILYFLDIPRIQMLARDLARRWPLAEVICVSYLGPSGNTLQGAEALAAFTAAMAPSHAFTRVDRAARYRIDRGVPPGLSGARA